MIRELQELDPIGVGSRDLRECLLKQAQQLPNFNASALTIIEGFLPEVEKRQFQRIAKDLKVPLADFHAECIRRRPEGSWDGTLISRDGVHPSGGKSNDYSEANLQNCGYALRNWVNFLVFRQLYFRVFNPED